MSNTLLNFSVIMGFVAHWHWVVLYVSLQGGTVASVDAVACGVALCAIWVYFVHRYCSLVTVNVLFSRLVEVEYLRFHWKPNVLHMLFTELRRAAGNSIWSPTAISFSLPRMLFCV